MSRFVCGRSRLRLFASFLKLFPRARVLEGHREQNKRPGIFHSETKLAPSSYPGLGQVPRDTCGCLCNPDIRIVSTRRNSEGLEILCRSRSFCLCFSISILQDISDELPI